jgi:hypothetical protein
MAGTSSPLSQLALFSLLARDNERTANALATAAMPEPQIPSDVSEAFYFTNGAIEITAPPTLPEK